MHKVKAFRCPFHTLIPLNPVFAASENSTKVTGRANTRMPGSCDSYVVDPATRCRQCQGRVPCMLSLLLVTSCMAWVRCLLFGSRYLKTKHFMLRDRIMSTMKFCYVHVQWSCVALLLFFISRVVPCILLLSLHGCVLYKGSNFSVSMGPPFPVIVFVSAGRLCGAKILCGRTSHSSTHWIDLCGG